MHTEAGGHESAAECWNACGSEGPARDRAPACEVCRRQQAGAGGGEGACGSKDPARDRCSACEACRRQRPRESGFEDDPLAVGPEAVMGPRASGRASGVPPELGTGDDEEVADADHHCQKGDAAKKAELAKRQRYQDGNVMRDAAVEDDPVVKLSRGNPERGPCAGTGSRGDRAVARIACIVREMSVWPVLDLLPEEEVVSSRWALAHLACLLDLPCLTR